MNISADPNKNISANSKALDHNADQAPHRLPLISFIVVNFNYGRFLETCITSIMTQNYDNIECIIVDNASTDISPGVIKQLVHRFPNLRVLNMVENAGQNAACCAGLSLSRGSYIAFIDADDYLLPSYAGTHIRAHLSVPFGVGFSSGDMVQMVNDTIVLGHYHDAYLVNTKSASKPVKTRPIEEICTALGTNLLEGPEFSASLRLVSRNNIHWVWTPTSGNVYRRDALLLLAGNPQLRNLRFAADAYYNFAVNALSGSLIIQKPLAVYRIHGANCFTQQASLNGAVGFVQGTDDGGRAAFFALDYMVAEYDAFLAQAGEVRILDGAMQVLRKRAQYKRNLTFERIQAFLKKRLYAGKVRGLKRRFNKQSLLERRALDRKVPHV